MDDKLKTLTLKSLASEETLEALERLEVHIDDEKLRKILSDDAKKMIDQLHVLMCKAEECDYWNEESMLETWHLPAHVEWTTTALFLLNHCKIGLEDWEDVFSRLAIILTQLRGDFKLITLLQAMFNKDEILYRAASAQPKNITTPPEP